MKDYYAKKLNAENLRRVYEVASPRIRQYLRAEIDFVMDRLPYGGAILETGCGYGRVLEAFRRKTNRVFGVDSAVMSLMLGMDVYGPHTFRLAAMDAARLAFKSKCFDVMACIQNGISAFKVDPETLFREAIRVTRPGGRVLFSTYSEKFWPDRLQWFRDQSAAGLLGEIDEEATGNGVIVCKDGFRATTATPDDFWKLADACGVEPHIREVDGSSLFCEIIV